MLALCALPDMAAPATACRRRPLCGAGRCAGSRATWGRSCARRTPSAAPVRCCCRAAPIPYGPKTLRAAMGAVFRLPLYAVGLPRTCRRLLADAGLPLYGTALRHDTVDVRQRRSAPLRAGHRQRGPGRQRGGAGAVPRDAAHPHVVPLRVAERRRSRGGGAAVGGVPRRGGQLTWPH